MTSRPTSDRFATRVAAIGAVTMIIGGVWAITSSALPSALAATDAGAAEVVVPQGSPDAGVALPSGGSATDFTLRLPEGAACTGDSANDSFRVQSYMVPVEIDPASLTFDANGPMPGAYGDYATFRQPLYDLSPSPYVDAQTANASTPGGPGPVINVPAFSLAVFAPGDVAAGTYNVGIACTPPLPESAVPGDGRTVAEHWNVEVTITEDTADEPAGITWTAANPELPVTTTTTTSTTSTTSTSTTTSSSTTSTSSTSTTRPTTTTSSPTTSTSTTSSTTSSTVPGAAGTTTTVVPSVLSAGLTSGGPSSGGTLSAVGELPMTGSNVSVLVWAVLLVVLGRMAVLLARTPAVRPRR